MDPFLAILAALATLTIGLALGWQIGRSRAGAIAEERGKEADRLRVSLDEVMKERDQCVRDLATLQADARNFEARMAELLEAKEALSAQFHEVGTKLLSEAQKQFLERADSRFNQASEKSEAQLKALLQPVEATLKRYEEGLTKVEKERVGSYEALREAVTLLHAGHNQVRDETARLVNALRSSPKARGRWGEQSLKNVLEQAGLSPYADFQTEVSVDTADGRLRPDVVVRLFACVEEGVERAFGIDDQLTAARQPNDDVGSKAPVGRVDRHFRLEIGIRREPRLLEHVLEALLAPSAPRLRA